MRRLPPLLLALAAAARAAPDIGCPPDLQSGAAALNALRARPQQCGGRWLAPAPALQPWAALGEAAQRHAIELSHRDRLDHAGADGTTLRSRLLEAGYAMRVAGENLAGGPETLDEALAHWLASPEHCENLMEAEFQDFGLACVSGPGRLQRYWVLELAAPAGPRPARSSPDRSP